MSSFKIISFTTLFKECEKTLVRAFEKIQAGPSLISIQVYKKILDLNKNFQPLKTVLQTSD
jgi:hypothetical protein